MRRITVFTALLIALIVIGGCGIGRKATGGFESHSEAIKVIEHSEFIPVMVDIAIPAISAERAVRDSSSHLENQFAESDARIELDGSLYHSLNTKPQTLHQDTEVKIEYRDSIITKEVKKEVPVPYPIEKELNWWQKFRLKSFWALLAISLIVLRKPLSFLLKKLFALIA